MLAELFWMIAGGGYIGGRGAHEIGNRAAEQSYIASKGYNKERQTALERMATSADVEERRAFERLCGYIPHGAREQKQAIREIAMREGWKYHDSEELFNDPDYVKMVGGKFPDWLDPAEMKRKWQSVEDKTKERVAEIERRKAWIARCPHGDEVHVFPMNFDTEEQYRAAVHRAYLVKSYG